MGEADSRSPPDAPVIFAVGEEVEVLPVPAPPASNSGTCGAAGRCYCTGYTGKLHPTYSLDTKSGKEYFYNKVLNVTLKNYVAKSDLFEYW